MISRLADKLAESAIHWMAKALPLGSARGTKRALQCYSKAEQLQALLSALPIESITVRGEQGIFEGSAADVSVLQRYAIEGVWSPRTLRRIFRVFGTSVRGTYIDVGANIGLTSIPVAARGIKVLAFEPVPQNFAYLQRNIGLNSVSGVVVAENCALLAETEEVTFEMSPSNHGDHRYRRSDEFALMGEQAWQTVRVHARKLDEYLNQVEPPLVLKIDTQGAEPLVIAGGLRVVQNASMIISEFSPYAMQRMGVDPTNMIEQFMRFPKVEIFEGEDEDNPIAMSGDALRRFLSEYVQRNKTVPFGKYLNLIGSR